MPHRPAVVGDERFPAGVQHRPLHRLAANRIGPVENHKADAVPRGLLHRVAHGRRVGIEADTHVLDVDHQRVDIAEHCIGRPQCLAIEAVNRQAGRAVAVVYDAGSIELAARAVLGAEDGHQPDAFGPMEKVDRTFTSPIQAGLVSNQADTPAAKRSEIFGLKNVDARADLPHWFFGDCLAGDRADVADERIDVAVAVGMDAIAVEEYGRYPTRIDPKSRYYTPQSRRARMPAENDLPRLLE